MTPIAFEPLVTLVEARLCRNYQVPIVTRDVPDPLTGDLDGAEIHIDYAVGPELRLFLLAHLFGHTVQWNTNPDAFELGKQRTPPVGEDVLAAVIDYEREAARYSLALLHEAGVVAADQWLSDFSAADGEYLRHYYRTGEKRDFDTFRRAGAPLLTPLAIPPFQPSRQRFRLEGIVI